MKTLSIIIPHHNQPDLLQILLDSIGIEDWMEVIVVDDHSDRFLDEYQALTQKPAYRAVTFMSNPDGKRGPGCARNLGIDKASGTYLMFCDSDDYLVLGYKEKVKPYLEKDIDLVYFSPISRILGTDEDAHRVDKYIKLIADHVDHPDQKTEDALRYTFYSTVSRLYSRSMIETHQIRYGEMMVSEDVMFATMTGHHARSVIATKETIYCATRSAHSLTMTMTPETFNTRFEVMLRQHAFVRNAIGRQRYLKLDLPSAVFIANAFTYHLGLMTALKVTITMIRHRIPILHPNTFKPSRILAYLKLSSKARKTRL